MLDTITKNLCGLMKIKEENFKQSQAGGYTASNRDVMLRKYSGNGWDGLEARHTDDERWEFDVTYDNDACRLEAIMLSSCVLNFRQAAAKTVALHVAECKPEAAKPEGKKDEDLYSRLNDGCYRRISDSDREGYSTLTLEVKPGEEMQAAQIIYSLLNHKTKSSQTPAQPKKKLSRAEIFALKFAKKSLPSSKD